jgi:hypothetical protein
MRLVIREVRRGKAHASRGRPPKSRFRQQKGLMEGWRDKKWSRQQTRPKSLTWAFVVERVTRIELAL